MTLGEHVGGEGIDRRASPLINGPDNTNTHLLVGKFVKEFGHVGRFHNGNAHIDEPEIKQDASHIELFDGGDDPLDRVDRRQPVLVAVKNDLDIARCAVWKNATQ